MALTPIEPYNAARSASAAVLHRGQNDCECGWRELIAALSAISARSFFGGRFGARSRSRTGPIPKPRREVQRGTVDLVDLPVGGRDPAATARDVSIHQGSSASPAACIVWRSTKGIKGTKTLPMLLSAIRRLSIREVTMPARWLRLVVCLVVSVGTVAATSFAAGARVEPHRDAEGDRRGHHRRRDPRRGHRRRRDPDRARLLQGREGRSRGLRRSSSTARLVAVVSRAARSWSTSTIRSSTRRHDQRRDSGV